MRVYFFTKRFLLCSVLEHSDKQSQEESKLEKPIGSQYGEFSSRLISARKSLMKRHKVNEEDVIESSSK